MQSHGQIQASLPGRCRAVVLEWFTFYESRLRRHWPGFWGEFAPYLLILFLAATADFVTTHRFMLDGSVLDEAHPAIRMLSVWWGPFYGPLLGKVIQVLATIFLTLLLRPHGRKILIPVSMSYLLATAYNHWVLWEYDGC